MKTVYENKFIKIQIIENNILKYSWTDKNKRLNDRKIKLHISKIAEHIRAEKPKFILGLDENRKTIYALEIQKWIADELGTACEDVGASKYAIILPKDVIASISTQQIADEAKKFKVEGVFFDNEQEALKWFKNGKK